MSLPARSVAALGSLVVCAWTTSLALAGSGPPVPASSPDPRNAAFLQACGAGDERLHEAAVAVAERVAKGRAVPDMHELTGILRAQQDPHTRPRAWTLRAVDLDRDAARVRLSTWLRTLGSAGVRRCGVASIVDSQRGETVAVVVADAIADTMTELPDSVRTSSWLTVEARSLVHASEARLVVLGPRGAPRTIPTSFDRGSGRVLGRFMADRPGRWVVQLLLTIDSGPQPALELEVEAGDGAADRARSAEAPGETAVTAERDNGVAMTVMLNVARKTEGMGSLIRDVRLDAVAERHVKAMMKAGVMAHEAGDGNPASRMDAAGLSPRELGENVARAPSPALAHRVLWDSPSHRGNMLHGRFKRVGVAAARDASGAVWVTQVFASGEPGWDEGRGDGD